MEDAQRQRKARSTNGSYTTKDKNLGSTTGVNPAPYSRGASPGREGWRTGRKWELSGRNVYFLGAGGGGGGGGVKDCSDL